MLPHLRQVPTGRGGGEEGGGEKPVIITGARRPEWDPGTGYVAYVFVFLGSITICRL
jgi:hypothetical protein